MKRYYNQNKDPQDDIFALFVVCAPITIAILLLILVCNYI